MDNVSELAEIYKNSKKELEEIVKSAKKQNNEWRKIINLFNSRFSVPFEVSIKNYEDVILKEETAQFSFHFKNSRQEIEKQTLIDKVLSNGEKRALYIMQILFEIERRKKEEKEKDKKDKKFLLIFDDICDSFDYKNKYAIVEYLQDISEIENFHMICLTHNFDFYRILNSRLKNKKPIMVTKNEKEISFEKGQYTKDFADHLKQNIKSNEKIFYLL